MDFFNEFMQNYGMQILGMIITGIAGYLGIVAKGLVDKYLKDKTVKEVAKVVAMATEQMWKNLHGEDKLQEALKSFSEMLEAKGIAISEVEMRLQLEAAVGEFNKAFEQTNNE